MDKFQEDLVKAVDITDQIRRIIDENFYFEKNSEYTRNAVIAAATSYLKQQSLHSYRVICDETNNPETEDKWLWADIVIMLTADTEITTRAAFKVPDTEYRRVKEDRDRLEAECKHLRGKLELVRREGKVKVVHKDMVPKAQAATSTTR